MLANNVLFHYKSILFYYSKLSKNQDKTINNAQCSNEMLQSFFKKEKRKKKKKNSL